MKDVNFEGNSTAGGSAPSNNNVKVWTCKILVPADVELPNGFDLPPRSAAIEAVEAAGIPVLVCSSGWGGSLTKAEMAVYRANAVSAYPNIQK